MKWFERRRFLRFTSLSLAMLLGVMTAGRWLSAQEEAPAEAPAVEEVVVAEETVEEAPAEEAPPAKAWGEMSTDEKLEKLAESSIKVDDAGNITSTIYGDGDILWICLAAFLVFFMQAGFALVEAGLTRAKNTCNILMKNLMDFVLGSIIFWMFGFGLMFGTSMTGFPWVGTDNFLFDAEITKPDNISYGWAFLIFQTVFCATTATIVSGAMAERTKFVSYLVYTAAITAFVYPVFGAWAWGNFWNGTAWLGAGKGFLDFAGSTVVHSVGGWASLAGAIIVGPRIGKFVNGKVVAIPGHSIPMVCLGVFILWLGWFGFNPGSTTAIGGGNFAFIAVTTNIAACGGGLTALITTWIMYKKPDPSLTMNGVLAGLVSITAGCNVIPVHYALLTGMMAGVLVIFACRFFDSIRVDDPVGAISVHGVCGAFGTICVGIFAKEVGLVYGGGTAQLMTQLLGVGVAFVWAFGASSLIFLAIKATIGLRVTEQEELEGLDLHEHGMGAYPAGWIAISDQTMSLPTAFSSGSHNGGVSVPSGAAQAAT
jgi:Amt family ammonium transporter